MKVDPKKYWAIDSSDIRMITLQKFAESIDGRAFETQSVDEIIKFSIDALRQFKIRKDQELALKEAILGQNMLMQDVWVEGVRQELQALGTPKVTIISLGCGDESAFERAIAEDMAKNCPGVALEWAGVDIEDYRSPTSFLQGKPLKIVDPNASVVYRSLVETDNPVVLIGRWSYHHLGVSFEEFLSRCAGFTKIILVEEPTTAALWSLPDYRVMRIAYDMLANRVVSQAWANEFMHDPGKFKVGYVFLIPCRKGLRQKIFLVCCLKQRL